MPTGVIAEIQKIAARARRIGWTVESSTGSQDWVFRISNPERDGRVQLHGSPSDRHWQDNIIRGLNDLGFAEAEAAYLADQEEKRQAKIALDRAKNEKALVEAQKRANMLSKAAGPYSPQVADIKWIFTKHEMPETRRVIITPELAKKIIDELNTANRPIRRGRVAYWAGIIKRGRWRFTHQGIAFDTMARLQDGQHRLIAAVEQNFTLDINVSVGMPVENFGSIDTGAPRSASDAIALLGKPNVTTLSGATRLVAVCDLHGAEFRNGMKTRIPNDEMVEAVHRYGERLEEATRRAIVINLHRSSPKMSGIALSAGIYLISRSLREDDPRVEEFLRGYDEGTNLDKGDARLALRNYMSNLKVPGDLRKVSVGDQLMIFIKAWNSWSTGRKREILGIRRDELMTRPFIPPRLEDEE